MKKFTKILICLILCVFTFSFVSCGKNSKDNFIYPSASAVTYGNGGLAVQKGDYLYFVNGYLGADSQTEKNATYSVGSLIIAKLDSNGALVRDENELLKDDYYRVMSDRLCGFEATNLFVFGDYLYFASPCQEDEVNASGDMEWAKQRVDFNRIKLDKSGKVEKIYRSQVYNSNLEYTYYNIGNDVYLLALEKEESLNDKSDNKKSNILTCVKAGEKAIEVATNVNSVSFKDDNSYNAIVYSISDSSNNVYEIYKYNLANNESGKLCSFGESVEIKDVVNGYVYITKKGRNETELMRSNMDNINFETICYSSLYDSVFVTPDASAVIAVKSGVFEFYLYQSNTPSPIVVTDSDGKTITFIGFTNGSIVYLDGSNNLKTLSYSQVVASQIPEIVSIATLSSDADTAHFDMDSEYLYFYQTVGSNKYLHRIRINNNFNEKEEMIGVYLDEDKPSKETEEEKE